jgi:hypothetical protein
MPFKHWTNKIEPHDNESRNNIETSCKGVEPLCKALHLVTMHGLDLQGTCISDTSTIKCHLRMINFIATGLS